MTVEEDIAKVSRRLPVGTVIEHKASGQPFVISGYARVVGQAMGVVLFHKLGEEDTTRAITLTDFFDRLDQLNPDPKDFNNRPDWNR